jgi:LmbE family N-acetylglucosaminyl deacetylase
MFVIMERSLLALAAISIITHSFPPVAGALSGPGPAQAAGSRVQTAPVEDERGIVALDQSLRDLANPYTLMCVAAHPDDADYAALALYRKKLGARTVIVIATRGESRESLSGPMSEEEMGVSNTRQALEAARLVGADVYFLNLRDFGHSRSADEALSVWNNDEALARMVRAIRLLRPDVIITRHSPQSGTGQQQAVARLLLESFEAAADPERFQEANTLAWQVRRLFERSDEAEGGLTINSGEYDHTRGITYARLGQRALARLTVSRNHRPQAEKTRYRLVRPSTGEKIDPGGTLTSGLELPEKIARSLAPPRVGDLGVTEAIARREPLVLALTEKLIEKRAEGSPPEMRDRYGEQFFRMVFFIGALERALALALGLSFEVRLDDRVLVPGQSVTARLSLSNGSNQRLPATFLLPESLPAGDRPPPTRRIDGLDLTAGGAVTREVSYEVPEKSALTLPHSSQLYKESYYPVGSSIPGALAPDPFGLKLLASAEVGVGLTSIIIPALVRFDIARPVEIATTPFLVVKDWNKPREVDIDLRIVNRTRGELEGALWVVPLALAQDDYEPVHVKFAREDEETVVRLRLALPVTKPPVSPDILIELRREKPAPQDALGSFTIKVKTIEFEVADSLQVGYIPGPDSWVPGALSQLGVAHSELLLSVQALSSDKGSAELAGRPRRVCVDLSRFKTIIVGDRALSSRSELPLLGDCLLEYVRHGGNLVVFYQRAEDWDAAPERRQIAPFPIHLGGEHINQEAAPVKVLEKDHPLLTRPNAITEKDFDGWIKHRALYLPTKWDGQYTAMLESSDTGQEPQRGGLLVTRLGEGTYIYVSYDIGRQVMAANPGAFRLLANLISSGQ